MNDKTTHLLSALDRGHSVVILCPDADRAGIESWLAENRPDIRVKFQLQAPARPRPQVMPTIEDEAHSFKRGSPE